MQSTIGERKFNSIFFAEFFENVVGVVLAASDSVIVGQIIGLDGLAAMNIIVPFTTLSIFFTSVISCGAKVVYSRKVGAFQNEEAERVMGQSIVMSVLLGICLLLGAWFMMPLYIRHSGLSAHSMNLAGEYLFFYGFCMLISPIKDLLAGIAYVDGRENVAMASAIEESVGNIVFSIPLGMLLGMRGIAFGTFLSNIIALIILLVWRGGLRFHIEFSGKHLKDIFLGGIGSDTMFLYLSILGIMCNYIVTKWIGAEYISTLTLLYIMIEMGVIMELAGESMEPMITAYIGEKNHPGVRKLMHYIVVINVLLGVVLALVTLAAAPLLPLLVDIDSDPLLYASCVKGLRIFAFSNVPLGCLAVLDSYWLLFGKYRLAFLSNFLKYFACAAVLLPVLGRQLGIIGIWLSFPLGYILSLLVAAGLGYLHYGRDRFPYFLDMDGDTFDYSFVLDDAQIKETLDLSEKFLRDRGLDDRTVLRILLFIEELLFLTKNKNREKKVYSEICLRVEEEQTLLVLWDDGVRFDITEQDGIVSEFREYFVARLMGTVDRSVHQTLAGVNRTGIKFYKKGINV